MCTKTRFSFGKFEECGTGTILPKNMIEVGMVSFPQLYGALSTNLPNLVITL